MANWDCELWSKAPFKDPVLVFYNSWPTKVTVPVIESWGSRTKYLCRISQMDSPLMEAGMDSLSSVEFRNQVGPGTHTFFQIIPKNMYYIVYRITLIQK